MRTKLALVVEDKKTEVFWFWCFFVNLFGDLSVAILFLAALAALYLPLVRITVRNRWITVGNWLITVRNRWINVRNRCHFRIWAQIVTFETFVRNDD